MIERSAISISDLRSSVLEDPPLNVGQRYWKFVEDLVHLRTGCRNYRAYFVAKAATISSALDQPTRSWSLDESVAHAYDIQARANLKLCTDRVAQVDSILGNWFTGTTSIPSKHLDEVQNAIATGQLKFQSNLQQ